jgi:hypothetical protein
MDTGNRYELAPWDVKILRLVALGWSDGQITGYLGVQGSDVSSALLRIKQRTRVGKRLALALLYVEELLPHDVTAQEGPGVMLERWQGRAAERLADVRRRGGITPTHVEAFTLLVSPDYRNLTYADVGGAMTPPLTGPKVSVLVSGLAGHTKRTFDEPGPWAAVVWRLAGDGQPPIKPPAP